MNWKVALATLGICLGMASFTQDAEAGRQLLFQAKTNKYLNKLYQFYAITKGPEKTLVGLAYYRKTWKEVRKVPSKAVLTSASSKPLRPVIRKKYVTDPCYPVFVSFRQIRRGTHILKAQKAPKMSNELKTWIAQKEAGQKLPPKQAKSYKTALKRYCHRFNNNPKGRIVNAIRGFGAEGTTALDPNRGGTIVTTYMSNGVLNFFRGRYRYVVLKLRKKQRITKGKVSYRWSLETKSGKSASRIFFRTYALGISGIELGMSNRKKPFIRSFPCPGWINARGNCRHSFAQRKAF